MPGISNTHWQNQGGTKNCQFFRFHWVFPPINGKNRHTSPLARTFHSEKSLISQLSFSELNSIESTESIEFVEDHFYRYSFSKQLKIVCYKLYRFYKIPFRKTPMKRFVFYCSPNEQ